MLFENSLLVLWLFKHYKKWLFETLPFLSVSVLWRFLLWRHQNIKRKHYHQLRQNYVLSGQCVSTLETCVITECIQHILWQPDTGGRVQRYLLFSATQHQASNNQAAVQISVNKHLPWSGSSFTPAKMFSAVFNTGSDNYSIFHHYDITISEWVMTLFDT